MKRPKRIAESVRTVARETAERVITGSGIDAAFRRYNRDSAVILAYHNVVPSGASPVGDRSLHLPREEFAEQLDLLESTHRIVALGDLKVPKEEERSAPRPRAVITFDDAYRGAVTVGLEELRRRGLPATMFVAPGRLGNRGFWWDEVAEIIGVLDPATRSTLLTEFGGLQEAVERWMADRGFRPPSLPEHARSATEAELREAVSSTDITLGSHTWSHPHLPNLVAAGEGAVTEELVRSGDWLSTHFPDAYRPWLAYPYGATSAEVIEAAASAGYRRGAVIGGGLWRPSVMEAHSRELPRLNVPAGLSLRGFCLQTAGLFLS